MSSVNRRTQNRSLENVHDNTRKIDEPYAIDVPDYKCKLCNYGPMSKILLNIHFEVKHNAPPVFDEVPSNRVQCSSCRAIMLNQRFDKHKARVHNSNLPDITSQKKSHQRYAERDENIEEPLAIDDEISMKWKVCGAEVTEKTLENHFAVNHRNYWMEFVAMQSEAACKSQEKETHFQSVQVPINIHSPEQSQVMNNQRPHTCLSITKESESFKNDVHQNQQKSTRQPEGIGEPYAIDIPVYNCKFCKIRLFSDTLFLKMHFKSKHNNAPLNFDERFGKRVQCSSCGAKMFTKNFNKHKAKVHSLNLAEITDQKKSQRCNKNFEGVSNSSPYPIDMPAIKCKVCGAECRTERILNSHFAVHHQDVSIEFVVGESYKFVQCSACRIRVSKRHFIRHTNRCPCRTDDRTETHVVEPLIKTGSLTVKQMTNYDAKQKARALESDESGMKEFKEQGSQFLSLRLQLNARNTSHTVAPRLFGCGICDAVNILEQNKMKHFLANHSNDSNRKYVLKALNDHFYPIDSKKKLLKLRCQICLVEFNENHYQRHMRRAHSKSFAISEKKPSTGDPTRKSQNKKGQADIVRKLISVKVYKCLACDARDIMEPNLMKHHLKKHVAIPMDINIFKMDGKVLRERCNICQRLLPEGHMNKHKKRSHFNKNQLDALDPTDDLPRYSKVFNRTRIQHMEPVSTEIHKCTKCNAVVSKDNLKVHRKNHKVKRSVDLFHLIGIKDVIKCTACLQFIEPGTFMEHIKRHSALIFVSTDGKPLRSPEPEVIEGHTKKVHKRNYDLNFVELYKCGCCDTHGILKRHLVAHHSRMHNFPINRNNFKVHTFRQKIECDCCGKRYMEGRQTKHHLKSCLQRATAIELVLKEQREQRGVEAFKDEHFSDDDVIEEFDYQQ